MASNPDTRRATVKGSAFTSSATDRRRSLARASLGIGIALGFALPAQAETVTLSCEGEMRGEGASAPRSWTVDIDYTAKAVKWDEAGALELPAVITEREITFFHRDDKVFIQGTMDRLAGTMTAARIKFGQYQHLVFQGRCRPAAKPKW